MCHSLHTAKMTATNQKELFDQLRVLWFFIELNLLLFIMISRHRRQQNPAPAQPATPPQPQPPPCRRKKPQNQWVMPLILQREERGCYRTLLDELITDIPGYRNFTRMEPTFFYLSEERITPDSFCYIEILIQRIKLHFTAIPLEGWKNDQLQICLPGLQRHLKRILTGEFDKSHRS